MPIKYVFFDLDETLVDIKNAQNFACEKLFYLYNFGSVTDIDAFKQKWDELTEYHYSFYTKKLISYEEQRIRRITDLFKDFGISLNKESIAVYNEYLQYFEQGWCIYDDVESVLSSLKQSGYTLGVISNGDLVQQTQKCNHTGISKYLDVITTSSEYSYSKPSLELYQAIFERYNINPSEFCYVGNDIRKDVLPCLSLGTKAIWINRRNKPTDEPVIQITTLAELPALLQRI